MSTLVLEQLPVNMPEPSRKSGRAVRDHRGDAVWEWQVATGVFERDVTDEQLHRLQASELTLVESPQDCGTHIYDSGCALPQLARARREASRPATLPRRGFWARITGF